MNIQDIEIGFSPISGNIYIGKSKGAAWIGEKKDVTGNFIEVMLQKFNTGEPHTITVAGKPKFIIEVREIKNAESKD